ncbi:hypothetical protein HAX54_004516 [Datura stramonium]|uniref:Uncharacterized protein n=1 Tax=Datura stramonium TaxID=4076 RepID=A0ABS8RX79_DATST|nr:hypothetical protein [Datura stramonium]
MDVVFLECLFNEAIQANGEESVLIYKGLRKMIAEKVRMAAELDSIRESILEVFREENWRHKQAAKINEVKIRSQEDQFILRKAQELAETSGASLPQDPRASTNSASGFEFGSPKPEDDETTSDEHTSVPPSSTTQALISSPSSRAVEDLASEVLDSSART